MSVSGRAEPIRQREVITRLGDRAIDEDDVDGLLADAVDAVADTLDADHCAVHELSPDGDELFLRCGVGIDDGNEGVPNLDADGRSQPARTLASEGPVLVTDLGADDRVSTSGVPADGVTAGITAVVGTADDPWGVLGVHTGEEREFSDFEASFVEAVANVLASAVETERTNRQLDEQRQLKERIVEAVQDGVYVVDDDQRFTTVNDAYAEMVGYDREELIGEHVSLVVDDDVVERARETEASLQDGDVEATSIEANLETASGDRFPAEATFAMLPTADGGERRVAVVRDVSDRQAREQERRQFETLFKESRDVNVVLERDGTYRYATPSMATVLGHDPEKIVGDDAFDYVHPEDRDRVMEEFSVMIEDPDQEPTVEYRYRHADGSWRVIESRGRNLLDDPEIEGIVVYSRDVTERRETQRMLEESERRYRTLVEHFPNGAVGMFDDDLRYTVAGGGMLDDVGASSEDIVGQTVWDRYPEDLAEQFEPRFEAALAGERSSFDMEFHDREWHAYTLPIEDEGGDVFAGMVMVQDVTEQKDRERKLQERERRLEQYREYTSDILDTIDDVFYVLDEDGRLQRWNESLAAVTGYSDEEIADMHASDFFDDEQSDAVDAAVREGFETGSTNVEVDLLTKAGDSISFEFAASRLDDPWGNPVIAGIGRDVTEHTERERALEESERRYRTLAEHFPNGVVGVYDQDLRYTLAEGMALDDTLPDADRIEGDRVPDIFSSDAAEDLEPLYRAAIADGETGSITTTFAGRHWEVWATPLRDADDEIFAGLSFAQDVTDQVERERDLERFETIVEVVNDGVYVVNDDQRFTMVNDAYAEMVGYDRDDLIGSDASVIVDEAVIEQVEELDAASAHGEVNQPAMETEVHTASGDLLPVEATFAQLPENDDAWHRVGVVRDITERVERERELERALDLLERTERIADVGGWEIDQETEDVFWSDHIFDLLEVSDDEEPPLDEALDMYHEEDRPIVEAAIEETMATGDPFDVEVRLRTAASDEVRWLRLQGVPETVDGEVVSLRGAAQDITERVERERELERRARQQRVVADLGQFALETDDLDELMTEAASQVAAVLDNEYCKVLDLDPGADELLLRQGVGWQEGIVGEATVSSIEADSQAAYTLATEEPVVVEDLETETRFSGPELLTSHDVHSGISTIIGSYDDPWGILGTHDTARRAFTDEDVSFVQSVSNVLAEAIERRKYQDDLEQLVEELEESNERLEQFAYAASHDLQEPLRMVSSYLQLIERRYRGELDEDGEEFLDFAVDGADRMRNMIDGLLQYSRVDTRGDPFETVDLDQVLDDARENLQMKIEETDAEITADELPPVHADAGQLGQVFQNLLDNAIEYSGDEPPRVDVAAVQDGGEWVVSVRDEGIGIDPDDTDRIFEVFQSLHDQYDHTGTGIGLALCERIVERHGGDIWVESDPGSGSTFYFTLPTAGGNDE